MLNGLLAANDIFRGLFGHAGLGLWPLTWRYLVRPGEGGGGWGRGGGLQGGVPGQGICGAVFSQVPGLAGGAVRSYQASAAKVQK